MLAKCIDRRIRPSDFPLRQLLLSDGNNKENVPVKCILQLEKHHSTPQKVHDLSANEIGDLVYNHKTGGRIKSLLAKLPALTVDYKVQPISRNILRIKLSIEVDFNWDMAAIRASGCGWRTPSSRTFTTPRA